MCHLCGNGLEQAFNETLGSSQITGDEIWYIMSSETKTWELDTASRVLAQLTEASRGCFIRMDELLFDGFGKIFAQLRFIALEVPGKSYSEVIFGTVDSPCVRRFTIES